MDIRKILTLVFLLLLVAVCFLSEKIVRLFGDRPEEEIKKRSLVIKAGAAAAAAALYLVVFTVF